MGTVLCHVTLKLVTANSSVSGRTQKQLVEYVRENGAKRTPYQRFVPLWGSDLFVFDIPAGVWSEKCLHSDHNSAAQHSLFRRNSKIRMSARSLATDVPKQVSEQHPHPHVLNDELIPPPPSLLFPHSLCSPRPACVVVLSERVIQRQSQGPGLSFLCHRVLLLSAPLYHRPANRAPTSAPAFPPTEPVSSTSPAAAAAAAASDPRASHQTPQPSEGRTSQGCFPIPLRFSRCPH